MSKETGKAVLFENRYMDSPKEGKKMLREYYKARGRNRRRLGDALLIAVAVIYLLALILLGFDAELLIWALVSAALCVLIHFFYIFQTAVAMGRANRIYGDSPELETVWRFFEDGIEVTEGEERLRVPYTNITGRMEMERYTALLMPRSAAVLIKKGCFTKGSEEEFKAFIKRKCPRLK